jgi:gas vesicle protein
MADQTFQHAGRGQAGTARQTGAENTKSGSDKQQSIGEQAASTGREIREKAVDFAEASGEKIKEQASELADAAKSMASQATDKLKETVSEQKGAGAEYIGTLAETMRRAAREFDNELPIAGKYIRKAAAQVENVSDSIKTGDFNDLIENARTFARRQPTMFLGLAALAGFAAVRFLKSSPGSSFESGRGTAEGSRQSSRSEYRG